VVSPQPPPIDCCQIKMSKIAVRSSCALFFLRGDRCSLFSENRSSHSLRNSRKSGSKVKTSGGRNSCDNGRNGCYGGRLMIGGNPTFLFIVAAFFTLVRAQADALPSPIGSTAMNGGLASEAAVNGRTLEVPGKFATIQSAVDASEHGDRVIVAPGIYKEFVILNGKGIVLEGAGENFEAVIEPPSDKAAVTCMHNEGFGTVIRGFQLRDGAIGVNILNAYPQIRGNLIIRCGVGLSGFQSSPSISSNSIVDCGTGILIAGVNNPGAAIARNNISGGGAGISVNTARAGVYDNRIETTSGIGVNFFNNSSGDVVQNILRLNGGGAISWAGSAVNIIHNTIYEPAAIGLGAGNPAAVANNIIVGKPAIQAAGPGGEAAWASRNLLYAMGSETVTGVTLSAASGNIVADPRFLDEAGGSFELQLDSPAIDAGSVTNMTEVDFAGKPRPLDGNGDGAARPDMGAYEYGPGFVRAPVAFGGEVITNTVHLSWRAVDGATNFVISRGDSAEGPFQVMLATTNSSAVDAAVEAFKTYWYVIVGESPAGKSAASEPLRVRIGNHLPVAVSDAFEVVEDLIPPLNLIGNDSDADGDLLSVLEIQEAPSWVTIGAASVVALNPPANLVTNFQFRYVITDGQGGTGTGTVSIRIIATNDPPTIEPAAPVMADSLTLLTRIIDPDSTSFQLRIIRLPAHGVLTLGGTNLFYNPAHGFVGADSFQFTVSDGIADSGEYEVFMNVSPLPDIDQDLIPDVWENFWDINDPNADGDGDGASNRAEYLADTSPRSLSDVLRIFAISRTDEGFTKIRWRAKGGVRYRIWSADRLSGNGGDFAPIVLSPDFEVERAPLGETVERSFIDTRLPAASQRYYRVQVVNQ
jgi:hypothetical protein